MLPNEDVIQEFSQFRNIFNDLIVFSEETFFIYSKFNDEVDCLLQLTKTSNLFGVYLHALGESSILENYMNWFEWIFSM